MDHFRETVVADPSIPNRFGCGTGRCKFDWVRYTVLRKMIYHHYYILETFIVLNHFQKIHLQHFVGIIRSDRFEALDGLRSHWLVTLALQALRHIFFYISVQSAPIKSAQDSHLCPVRTGVSSDYLVAGFENLWYSFLRRYHLGMCNNSILWCMQLWIFQSFHQNSFTGYI